MFCTFSCSRVVQVGVLSTMRATGGKKKEPGTLNWVSRQWLCSLVPSSWNRFHMAGLETFPVGRASANGSFCKGSASYIRSPSLGSVCSSSLAKYLGLSLFVPRRTDHSWPFSLACIKYTPWRSQCSAAAPLLAASVLLCEVIRPLHCRLCSCSTSYYLPEPNGTCRFLYSSVAKRSLWKKMGSK